MPNLDLPVPLHFREYGRRRPGRPSLVLLHGLFGSAVNWHGIARRLEGRFHLVVPDLRNHGRSPHTPVMSYPAMARDLTGLFEQLFLERILLVGHSMGGKAAMWLTLERPQGIHALVPVDIAPVPYPHGFDRLLTAMQSLSLVQLGQRADADCHLARTLESPALRAYLLQNLVKSDGGWRWRVNLTALCNAMPQLMGFPDVAAGRRFTGDVLFIHGGRSDYLGPRQAAAAQALFPFARLSTIPGAGHWVYSDAPDGFMAALESVLPD